MNQTDILLQVTLKAWNTQVSRADKFFDAQTAASFEKEIAPGKNRIIYLLGHLVAVHDGLMTLFGFGPRLFADLDEAFVKNPDRATANIPSAEQLLKSWKESNKVLSQRFEKMTVNDWLSRHTAMTDEDLVKDPARNKLSVLVNRTSHLAYHIGQLMLAKEK